MCRGDRYYDDNKRISRLDILKEFPFSNFVTLCEIKGSDLLELVEQGVAKAECVIGAFPHFSKGISVQYDSTKPPMSRLVKMTLNGEPIDRERIYSMATVTYILTGGDGLSAAKKAVVKDHPNNNKSLFDTVVEWIEENRKISARKEGRIFDVSKTNQSTPLNF